ncbi:unnamed protein product [Symbiodinium natans]|uniref:Uncharacterized protein n=1 Tax=Symbiodinium natans TaxID=878477 RepID=A0A812PYR8_9DINO|nr:unnamed protein product [Symbiodinium natans]
MSYALMKHPDGLLCQVFISHAWAEGLFELGDLVWRAWPRLQGIRNMYCCLLANPQNLDIGQLLSGPPKQSPFARAMRSASHVLVIPNETVSIYTRLWCVYEAYLGTCWHKTCLMPTQPKKVVRRSVVARTIILPAGFGLLLGSAWLLFLSDNRVLTHKMATMLMFLCVTVTALCFAVSLAMKVTAFMFTKPCRLWVKMMVIRTLHILLLSLCTTVACAWYIMKHREYPSPWQQFLHYFIPLALVLFNLLRISQLNQQRLEGLELSTQAGHLQIRTLDEATCTNPTDELRIREDIRGHEADVDLTIRVLMKAGAYNDSLRNAFEAGLDISGIGNTDLLAKMGTAILIWVLAIVDSAGFADNYFSCQFGNVTWLYLSIALTILMTMLTPVLIWRLHLRGQHQSGFAVKVWMNCASVGLGIPLLVQIETHLLTAMHFLEKEMEEPQNDELWCPPWYGWFMVSIFRPMVAVLSAVAAVPLGGTLRPSYLGGSWYLVTTLNPKP